MPGVQKGEPVFFGAWEGQELCGVSALNLRQGGHIALLFVRKEWQLRGVGRTLYQEMCRFCVQRLRINRITVNAAPGAVESYRHYGMQETAPEQKANGMRFVPMEAVLSGNMSGDDGKKKKRLPLILGIVAGVLLLLALLGWIVSSIVKDIADESNWSSSHIYEIPDDDYNDDGQDDYGWGDGWDNEDDWYDQETPDIQDDGNDEEELSGIDAIPEYKEEGITYQVTDDVYTDEGEDTKKTVINFEVHFPQITGLDGSLQDDINAKLKECAMETAEKIYLNPDAQMKEKVITEESPVLASFVEYKVCYQSADFMSVVYQDYSYEGSQQDTHVRLRTLNINLKDGTIYTVKDIVKLDDAFLADWLDEMRDEADNDELLAELDNDALKKCLSGEDETGVYSDNFFVDAEGIEIGFSFDYPADDENDQGYAWVTAPFDMEDIVPYQSDSGFWNLVSGK